MDIRVVLVACLCLVVRVQGVAHGQACTGVGLGNCDPNNHLTCDTTCKCETNYVYDTGACRLKVGQACTGTDASPCVSHTTCTNSQCTCATGYKGNSAGLCVATYDSTCTLNADCTASLTNSACTNNMCKCATGYKVNAATPKACVAVIGMTCQTATDCNTGGITAAECSSTTNTCKCKNGYWGATCAPVLGTKTCAAAADCTALKYSQCSSQRCACAANAVSEDSVCKLKADQTCVTGDLCPNNGGCVGAAGSMKCTCNTDYEAKEGKCAAKIIGMACQTATDCNVGGITMAECSSTTNTCKCKNGYWGAACTLVLGTKTCAAAADCTALKHSQCSSLRCACAANAVSEDSVCKLKADQTCLTGDLCPNNGACTGAAGSMKCTCNTDYEAKEGKCAAKNAGMPVKVPLMLILAAVLSVFLY